MNQHPYAYVVLRYSPDPGAGESLNVGVVLYAQRFAFLRIKCDSRYERLSNAFAGFDGPSFRRALANIIEAFRHAERRLSDRPLFEGDRPFGEWLTAVLPDSGASFELSGVRHGITADPAQEIEYLFDRAVESQRGHSTETPRRSDEQVWRAVAQSLPESVKRHITSRTISTVAAKAEFEHAVKNGRWHVIQPVSMDFKHSDAMQRKASELVGLAVGLSSAAELGSMIYVVGRPHRGNSKAYDRALALLDQTPIEHQIIDEADNAGLEKHLLSLVAEHQD